MSHLSPSRKDSRKNTGLLSRLLLALGALLVVAVVGIGIYAFNHETPSPVASPSPTSSTPPKEQLAYFKEYSKSVGTKVTDLADVYKDVQYCDYCDNPNDEHQQYDLYVPKNRPFGDVPIVVHVHGGGWSSGKRVNDISESYVEPLLERGIAFATVEYRLSSQAKYPAQEDDVHAAVEHLQDNADKYGIDSNRVIMLGDSAGGHLAAMEALEVGNLDDVKAVVMLYGVSDMWKQITQKNDQNASNNLAFGISDAERGFEDVKFSDLSNEELAKTASPYYWVKENPQGKAPPFLLVHGTADAFVPVSQSEDFAKELKANGDQVTVIIVEGAQHAFIGHGDPLENQVRPKILQFIEDNAYS